MEKEFRLMSDAVDLEGFRKDLKELLQKAEMPEPLLQELLLAVGEALTNIIRHAYRGKAGDIRIHFKDAGDRVEIVLRDYGDKFDPSRIPEADLPPSKPGGLGLYLIRKLTDKVEYDPSCETGNRLVLTKFKGENHEDSSEK